jgi:hypothetical protein
MPPDLRKCHYAGIFLLSSRYHTGHSDAARYALDPDSCTFCRLVLAAVVR